MTDVEKYRKRRLSRLRSRMDEKDRWVTTEKGHRVHISSEGVPDKGNPKVLEKMTTGGGVSKSSIEKAIGDKKTKSAIKKALKDAGYKVKEEWASDDDQTAYNYHIDMPGGGYIRVYGRGRSGPKVQAWNPQPKEEKKALPKEKIDLAKKKIQKFSKMYDGKGVKFSDLSDEEKYYSVLSSTYQYMKDSGMSEGDAWRRAFANADSHKESGFKGYESAGRTPADEWKDFFGKMLEDRKGR